MKDTLLIKGQLVKVHIYPSNLETVCAVRDVCDWDPYRGLDYEYRAFGGLPFHPEEVEDILPTAFLPSVCFS